jgi:hypothetical protein
MKMDTDTKVAHHCQQSRVTFIPFFILHRPPLTTHLIRFTTISPWFRFGGRFLNFKIDFKNLSQDHSTIVLHHYRSRRSSSLRKSIYRSNILYDVVVVESTIQTLLHKISSPTTARFCKRRHHKQSKRQRLEWSIPRIQSSMHFYLPGTRLYGTGT